MANAEVSESKPAEAPSDAVVSPPTPPVDVESPNSLASDVQDEPMEEDCREARSERASKVGLRSGSDLGLAGEEGGFGEEGSSLENDTELMGDCHVARMETEGKRDLLPDSENRDNSESDNCINSVFDADNSSSEQPMQMHSLSNSPLKADSCTKEQPMADRQAGKVGTEKKRKAPIVYKKKRLSEKDPNRRLTRSNCRLTEPNKRVTRSNSRSSNGEKSHVEYLGNQVDILGLERALKRLSRSGSKRVFQEPSNLDDSRLPLEKKSDCVELEKKSDLVELEKSGCTSSEPILGKADKEKTEVSCADISMQETVVNMETLHDTNNNEEMEIKIDVIMSERCSEEETDIQKPEIAHLDEPILHEQTKESPISLSNNVTEPMEMTAHPAMDESSELTKLEKSTNRRTRSSSKNVQSTSCNESGTPSRRFTRSLLKTDHASSHAEEGNGEDYDLSGLERRPAITAKRHRSAVKYDETEYKKFDLVKPPGNVRDLLATGLLEGLHVAYIIPHSKKPVLKGKIKNGNILCSCSACNGLRSVSAYNFEVHAGSTKKHPSDFIFFENGNTLRDVLRACCNTRVETLEMTIKNAVDPESKKSLRACLRCGYGLGSNVHKFFLCESCFVADTPNQPSETAEQPIHAARAVDRPLIPATPTFLPPIERPSKNLASLSSSIKKCSTAGRITRKNCGLHKLVFMNDILPEGTEVAYYICGKRLLDGYIKDGAIFCNCCMAVVSPSQFEAHAGQSSRRKPYNNIYTSNGVSLHELSVSLSKVKVVTFGETDDLCSICSDGGELIVCDVCPRAFHKECVGLEGLPDGDWYCQFCVSLHRRDNCVASNDNARAAGRVDGVDPIEQIFKRCIRMVSVSDKDLGGCAICKETDFSQSGFDNRTVILCDQCQREYHVGCLRDRNMADLKELPEGEWFCCAECSTMHYALKELILCGSQSLMSADLDLIRAKHESKKASLDSENENEKEKEVIDYDNIKWRLLCGASADDEVADLLSGAVSIFHESFDPIIDRKTRQDLIPAMVNGKSIEGHQDYCGMYCAVLTSGSKVVSAGLLRVFGAEAAELPLVATSRDLQGLGYFQGLFACIENMLKDLKVKHFVLPAAEEAESIWTNKFGFKRISSDQVEEYLKGAHITAFSGTSTLHKPLLS